MPFQVWGFSKKDGRLCFGIRTPKSAPAMALRKDALDTAKLLDLAAIGLFDQATEQFELIEFDVTHTQVTQHIWEMIQAQKDAAPGELTPSAAWIAEAAQRKST